MPISGTILTAAINTASSGDNTIVAAVSGEKVQVWKIFFWVNGTVSVTIKDGASTSLTGAMAMVAQNEFYKRLDETIPWFTTTAGNALVINLSGAIQISGRVYYTQQV